MLQRIILLFTKSFVKRRTNSDTIYSLRLKSSVASKWASKHHLFLCWWYLQMCVYIYNIQRTTTINFSLKFISFRGNEKKSNVNSYWILNVSLLQHPLYFFLSISNFTLDAYSFSRHYFQQPLRILPLL